MTPGSQEETCHQKTHQDVGQHEAARGRRLYADPPTEAASPSMESIARKSVTRYGTSSLSKAVAYHVKIIHDHHTGPKDQLGDLPARVLLVARDQPPVPDRVRLP